MKATGLDGELVLLLLLLLCLSLHTVAMTHMNHIIRTLFFTFLVDGPGSALLIAVSNQHHHEGTTRRDALFIARSHYWEGFSVLCAMRVLREVCVCVEQYYFSFRTIIYFCSLSRKNFDRETIVSPFYLFIMIF